MLAVVLETISTNVLVARTTASATLRAAHIVSVVPNVSYHKKVSEILFFFLKLAVIILFLTDLLWGVSQVFPDALFHQLLLAMSHADSETRVEAHNIFSVLLLRTLRLPWSDQYDEASDGCQSLESLKDVDDGIKVCFINWHFSYGFECDLIVWLSCFLQSLCSLRLSSHQVNMLLSSLWIQATSTENTPANLVAMASTFNITLLFSVAKVSSSSHLVNMLLDPSVDGRALLICNNFSVIW